MEYHADSVKASTEYHYCGIGESHKTVITFDLQLYEKAVKLQLHTAPALDHLVFRLGELHTVMAALRAIGSSIEDSGFDEAWVEAGIYRSTTKHQILEGNHMKRALTAHSMTYSVLSDLHVNAFLKTEKDEGGTDYPNTRLAAFSMKVITVYEIMSSKTEMGA